MTTQSQQSKHSQQTKDQKGFFLVFNLLALLSLLALKPFAAQAAITVKGVSTIATQVILSYDAPDENPCTIELSENASYAPLVHDVDPALFPGANSDHRGGGISNGTTRVIVLGKRAAERASSGAMVSRALQTNTPHFYRITCGSSQIAGQVTTQNIPLGNNFTDPMPVDPNQPGSYAFPAFSSTDRSEQIVDPQTGVLIRRLTVAKDNSTNLGFSPAGENNICSSDLTPKESGDLGYHCLLTDTQGDVLLWISQSTGELRPLGRVQTAFNPVPDGWGAWSMSSWDANILRGDPNTFLFQTSDWSGHPIILQARYKGQNQSGSVTQPVADCSQAGPPCIEFTNLTPASKGQDLLSQASAFEPALANFKSQYGFSGVTLQNGHFVLNYLHGGQNSYGWMLVFDPVTQKIIAARSSYLDPPTRWCGVHSVDPLGNEDWAATTGQFLDFQVIVQGNVDTALQSCPDVFGLLGQTQCTTIQVDGEPCDPTDNTGLAVTNPAKCGKPGSAYLQDAQVGDYFQFTDSNHYDAEVVRLLAKTGSNGTAWVVQRGINNNSVRTHSAGIVLQAYCSAVNHARPAWAYWYWNFMNDPHGTNTSGNTVLVDVNNAGSHTVYRPHSKLEAGYTIRTAPDIPGVITAAPMSVVMDGSWAGTSAQPWTVDSHPNSPHANQWFVDGRPWQGSSTGTSAPAQSVGGSLYKLQTNAYGGGGTQLSLNRNARPTLATCGPNVLYDLSGPASVITSGAADNFKYCVAKSAGECRSGSAIGDVYVNCPNVQQTSCQNAGQFGGTGDAYQDICIGDNGTHTENLIQVGIAAPDPTGVQSRSLTSGFTHYRRQTDYWNGHITPDGKWMLFSVLNYPADYGPLAGQAMLAKLPPWPGADAVNRSDFIPIPVPVTVPTDLSGVDNAVVEFGYAENGNPAQFYCTSRHEACVKGAQSGNTYAYKGDNVPGVPCTNGCTVTIPAIPQRMVYFQVDYRDASGHLLRSGGAQVVASEPPFALSAPGAIIGNLPTPTLNLPPFVPVNGTVQAGYPPGYNVSFQWSFVPADSTTTSGFNTQATQGLASQAAVSFPSPTSTASLGAYNLVPGYYLVRVYAQDNRFNQSPTTQGFVTLVPATINTVRVYPNPWRVDKHGAIPQITFGSLSADSTVKIFTVSGRLVKELHGDNTILWNLTDDSGNKVASGIYLYLVTDGQGNKAKGKVAVIK